MIVNKYKIELENDTVILMQKFGSVVNTADGKTYYFLPYWFKCDSDSEKSFVMHKLGELPKELIDVLETKRGVL